MEFSFKADMVVLYLPYLLQNNGLSAYLESEKLGSITILNLSSSMPVSSTSYQRGLSTRLFWMKALFKSSVETQAIVWRIQRKWQLGNDSKGGIQIRRPWCRYLHVRKTAKSMEPRELSSWPCVRSCFSMIWITLHSNWISPEFNEIQVPSISFSP